MSENNLQMVTVKNLSEKSDEEIIIQAAGNELRCFIGSLPYKIVINQAYPVRLSLLVLEDYEVSEIEDGIESIVATSFNGYSHIIKGKLMGGRLFAKGFVFDDYVLKDDFAYLDDKSITIKADRVDVEFL